MRTSGVALLTAAVAAVLPASAGAAMPSGTLRSSQVTTRPCHTGPITGPGVVRREARAEADGRITVRLDRGSGDWDVAVLDRRGRPVAAAATAGATEVAQGIVRAGRPLTVQACRRPGASRTVRLRSASLPLPRGRGARLRLVRVALPTKAAADTLQTLRLDLTEAAGPGFRDAVLSSGAQERALRRAGLRFRVLVGDLAAADRARERASRGLRRSAMPTGRTNYRRLADYSAELKGLAAAHPDLVRALTLPPGSLEGRPIEGIEIAAGVRAADGRPVFLQLGLHHAREWPSGELVMEFAHELVNRARAGDPRVRGLLARARVILVPVVNPDGFTLSREAPLDLGQPILDIGLAYKRKNCRLIPGVAPAPGACGQQSASNLGVDLNRNYGTFWGGPGSDASPFTETTRGAGPFSEPETQAVRALISSRQVVTLITNHTYGNLVLRPPGVRSGGDAPDEAVLAQLGAEMAAANGYVNQRGHDFYEAAGGTEDWSYFATGGLGYTFEIGSAVAGLEMMPTGFHPAYPLVIAEYDGRGGGGNREAYLRALESTADPARHAVITGTGVAGRTLRLTKTFDSYTSLSADGRAAAEAFPERLESTMTVPAGGRFTWHVNPSTQPFRRRDRQIPLASGTLRLPATREAWTLTCEAPGGVVLGRKDVVVDRGQSVDAGTVCRGTPLSFAVSERGLRTALSKGLRARVRCGDRCTVRVRATMTATAARRVGLTRGRKSVSVARGALTRSFTGRRTFALRFTRAARRVLRARSSVTLRVTATARMGGQTRTVTRSVTLRR